MANHLTINNIFAQLIIERNCSIIEKNISAILKHMEIELCKISNYKISNYSICMFTEAHNNVKVLK